VIYVGALQVPELCNFIVSVLMPPHFFRSAQSPLYPYTKNYPGKSS